MDQKVEEIPKNSSPYTLMAGETENGSPAEILVKMDQKPSKQNVTGKRAEWDLFWDNILAHFISNNFSRNSGSHKKRQNSSKFGPKYWW